MHHGTKRRTAIRSVAALLLGGAIASTAFAAGGQEDSDPQVVRIVRVLEETNPAAGAVNAEFARALEADLGIAVEERVITEYGVGIEAMRSGNLDVLLVSPMSYYQAKQRADVEPLVTTSGFGSVEYKSIFITQSDRNDINTLADLRGKTFAFVDPGSSSGYVYPKLMLVQELELDPDSVENPGYFFENATYSGGHNTSMIGVVMGDYDAAVVGAPVLPMMVAAGAVAEEDFKVIAETPRIANPLYIVRAELPEDLKDRIRAFYLGYDDPDYFEAIWGSSDLRYAEAVEEDYAVIDDIVRILGIVEE